MDFKKKFFLVILFPVFILLAMTVKPLTALFVGEEILLITRPVDPRDVFRGDYVRLSYEIEEVPLEKFPQELKNQSFNNEKEVKKLTKNGNIYGILKIDKGYAVIKNITLEKPKDKIYLKGKIKSFYQFIEYPVKPGLENVKESENKFIYVDFGLDKYFVPENTGKDLEELSREGQLIARVKVYNGYGLLVSIERK